MDNRIDKLKEINDQCVKVCFSDIEGKLHILSYDKTYLSKNADNLTFDGSSIRGFSSQNESDLKLKLDLDSLFCIDNNYYCFTTIHNQDGSIYQNDTRGLLKSYLENLKKEDLTVYVAAEIEGFLFKDNADSFYSVNLTSQGGYYTYQNDTMSVFLDEIQKTINSASSSTKELNLNMTEIEKIHTEVAPSQFEINWKYKKALAAADFILLYKHLCRIVAKKHSCTASFLPKPIVGVNGSGMHTNISISKNQKNMFYENGKDLSKFGYDFASNIIKRAKEICLVLNSSVNSYRRLDPAYEAPNEIFISPKDRGAMIRIPLANENSSRIEVRSVSPDANPYLLIYTLLKAGLEATDEVEVNLEKREKLPYNINQAIDYFENSNFIKRILGSVGDNYLYWKKQAASRSPSDLGQTIKEDEIIYHHEITNQQIWKKF